MRPREQLVGRVSLRGEDRDDFVAGAVRLRYVRATRAIFAASATELPPYF